MSAPPQRRRRVFVGVWEISDMVRTIAESLRAAGHQVESFVVDQPFNPYFSANRYDGRIEWPRGDRIYRDPIGRTRFNLRMAWRFLRAVRRFDTFVFVWRYSFLPFQLDIPILRLLRKDVVVFFCGNDVRYKPIQMELDRGYLDKVWWPARDPEALKAWTSWGRTFWEAFWTVKLCEKTGCRIVGGRDSATFQGEPWAGFLIPQELLTDAPRTASSTPLVIHAPTESNLKGTRQVEEAVEQLRSEGVEFQFRLIRGLPTDELKKVLCEADIVIDQPGWYSGRLGVLAMAAGAVVVGGNRPEFWHIQRPSPIQQFERDSKQLADVLRGLLADHDRRERLMRASWEYARDVHAYAAFNDFFEQLWTTTPYPVYPRPGQKNEVRRFAATRLQKAAILLFW